MKKAFKIFLVCCAVLVVYLGVLYSIQDYLLFNPNKNYQSAEDISLSGFSEVLLQASDGTEIMNWYHQGDKNKPAILFLHGNTGQIAYLAPAMPPLLKAGYTLLMMEYRGFGNTKGNISQKAVVEDAALAFDWLKNKGYSKVVVYGYSFGTAFSSALTEVRNVDGLILTAPFSSLYQLVSEKPVPFAKYILKDKYVSVDYLKKYSGPLLIIHGKNDELIPYHHAEKLFENAISPDKELKLLDGETHHSIFFENKNIPYILEFLKRI